MMRWPQGHWQTSLWRTTQCSKSLLSLYQVRPGRRYTDSPSCKVSRRNFVLNGIKWEWRRDQSGLFLLKQCNKKIRPFFAQLMAGYLGQASQGQWGERWIMPQNLLPINLKVNVLLLTCHFGRALTVKKTYHLNSGCHNVPLYILRHVSGATMPNYFLCQTIWNMVEWSEGSWDVKHTWLVHMASFHKR